MNSKQKGKRGELEFAAELRRIFGCEARRGQQFKGTEESPDVECNIPGVHWEVKRTEHLRLYEAVEQAREDCGEDDVPVVGHRRNHKEWVAIVPLEKLPELAVKLYLWMAS